MTPSRGKSNCPLLPRTAHAENPRRCCASLPRYTFPFVIFLPPFSCSLSLSACLPVVPRVFQSDGVGDQPPLLSAFQHCTCYTGRATAITKFPRWRYVVHTYLSTLSLNHILVCVWGGTPSSTYSLPCRCALSSLSFQHMREFSRTTHHPPPNFNLYTIKTAFLNTRFTLRFCHNVIV